MHICIGMLSTHAADELVDKEPVKQLLHINSDRAFSNVLRNGGLPYYKINDRVFRFRLSEVEQWLADKKKGGSL